MTATDRAPAARSRLLTPAEVIGVTGTEAPLTGADITAVAHTIYTPDRAAHVFTGATPEHARPNPLGYIDGQQFSYMTDARGAWVGVPATPRRGGHVAWRDLEAVLTRHATPATVRALVEAANASRRHLGAWHHAANDPWRRGPVPYDVETGARLERAARAGLDTLLTPPQVQGALFDLETT